VADELICALTTPARAIHAREASSLEVANADLACVSPRREDVALAVAQEVEASWATGNIRHHKRAKGLEMTEDHWVQGFLGAITVCDHQGIILEMNDAAAKAFQEQGGASLIGRNVLDCHPEPARSKLKRLFETQQPNVYTIEKGGVKRLIYQAPWYQDGAFAGLVELSLELPAQIPHFLRDRRG